MQKASASVTDVIVMETADVFIVTARRSSAGRKTLVYLQAEMRMNMSSRPMPANSSQLSGKYVFMLLKSVAYQ